MFEKLDITITKTKSSHFCKTKTALFGTQDDFIVSASF